LPEKLFNILLIAEVIWGAYGEGRLTKLARKLDLFQGNVLEVCEE
jgi:hypothetical protein